MGPLRSPRLTTRVALFFGLIALLAGLGLTTATYSIARDSLLDQRESAARSDAFDRALALRDSFEQSNVSETFLNLDIEPGGFAVLTRPEIAYLVQYPVETFPEALRASVERGQSGRQQFEYDGELYLGIGIHIAQYDTDYLEAFPLEETERTLRVIVISLLIGSALAALFATFFGFTTSRGLLRPLTRVADAAGEIAEGALDARLEPADDPELDRLVQSFNDMADAVQTRIEREARFSSDVSHELRTPITAMTAAAEVLDARRADLPERTRQALDVLVEQVRRFDSMVVDLLELSRLEAAVESDDLDEFDLVDWLGRAVHRAQGDHAVTVHSDLGPRVPVRVDRVRLERIVGNLLHNAQVHAGGAIAVRITAGATPAHVSIVVDDAGPGVAPHERERIFERFARGSAARHRIGTGLGLALVAEHTAAIGGNVSATDRPGGGARFIVELPIRTGRSQ